MFDPCGTRHIEGDEILRLLAAELGVDVATLRVALVILSASSPRSYIRDQTQFS